MADQTEEVKNLELEAKEANKKKMIKIVIIAVVVLALGFVVWKYVLKK
jgi:uncharacterized membrane protein (DUF373 family)